MNKKIIVFIVIIPIIILTIFYYRLFDGSFRQLQSYNTVSGQDPRLTRINHKYLKKRPESHLSGL